MDVMIDIETLGLQPGAVIAQIAAVKFDPQTGEIGDTFNGLVDIADAAGKHGFIEVETVLFWLKQPDAVRDLVFGGEREKFEDVMIALQRFCAGVDNVWAHSPSFDLTHLEAAFKSLLLAVPWTYKQARDTRTIYDLAGIDLKSFKNDNPHDGLSDAMTQAKAVIAAYDYFSGLAVVK